MSNIHCSATTKSGRPCRAWAVHYTDPPLCSSHSGRTRGDGVPESNKNRLTHGFYSRYFTLQEVSDLFTSADVPVQPGESTAAQITLRRILAYLERNGDIKDEDFQAAVALVFTGTNTVGRFLRNQRCLKGLASEEIAVAIATVLDQISIELGLEL
jgi:hypothetical protein